MKWLIGALLFVGCIYCIQCDDTTENSLFDGCEVLNERLRQVPQRWTYEKVYKTIVTMAEEYGPSSAVFSCLEIISKIKNDKQCGILGFTGLWDFVENGGYALHPLKNMVGHYVDKYAKRCNFKSQLSELEKQWSGSDKDRLFELIDDEFIDQHQDQSKLNESCESKFSCPNCCSPRTLLKELATKFRKLAESDASIRQTQISFDMVYEQHLAKPCSSYVNHFGHFFNKAAYLNLIWVYNQRSLLGKRSLFRYEFCKKVIKDDQLKVEIFIVL